MGDWIRNEHLGATSKTAINNGKRAQIKGGIMPKCTKFAKMADSA